MLPGLTEPGLFQRYRLLPNSVVHVSARLNGRKYVVHLAAGLLYVHAVEVLVPLGPRLILARVSGEAR